MATLKDVQFSREGEKAKEIEQSHPDGAPEYKPLPLPEEKTVIPKETSIPVGYEKKEPQQYVIFKLVNKNRRGGIYIPNVDDVINPKTGKIERVRLLVGVDTIWQKEQKDITKEYADKNARNMYFPRGIKFLRIPVWDSTLLEFARVTRHNTGAPNRTRGSKFEFYEYSPEREAKAAEEKELLELEMAIMAKEMNTEKMKKHASYLGILPYNEMGLPKTDQKLRAEYMLFAKKNATRFKETVDSQEIDIQYAIKLAIIDGRIDVGKQPGTAFWSNGFGVICRIPPGKDAVHYLTELALTPTPEGRTFKESLNKTMT